MSAALATADAVTGATLTGVGIAAWRQRPTTWVGQLTLLAAMAWFAGSLWAAAAYLHRGPLVHLHLSYPTGRLRQLPVITIVVLAYLATIAERVARDPWVSIAVASIVGAAAIAIFARAGGAHRKAGVPALWAALGLGSAMALSAVNQLLHWDADEQVAIAYDLVIAAMVGVLLVDLLRGKWAELVVSDLVTRLGSGQRLNLTRELRRALGDPSLRLGYWVPELQRYVDDTGQTLGPNMDDAIVSHIDDDGAPLAVVVHSRAALGDKRLFDGVSAATRLAVSNARLDAELLAQVAELDASRRRIVEVADAERQRLEAELEKGAVEHLRRAVRELTRLGLTTPGAGRVGAELDAADAELRRLARGLRPRALAQGGLGPALAEASELIATSVVIDAEPGRLPAAIEAALYFCCCECLVNAAKHASATLIHVDVHRSDHVVTARISDNGVGGADPRGHGLRGLADRAEALGGDFEISSPPAGGTIVTARIPVGTAQ